MVQKDDVNKVQKKQRVYDFVIIYWVSIVVLKKIFFFFFKELVWVKSNLYEIVNGKTAIHFDSRRRQPPMLLINIGVAHTNLFGPIYCVQKPLEPQC